MISSTLLVLQKLDFWTYVISEMTNSFNVGKFQQYSQINQYNLVVINIYNWNYINYQSRNG